MVIFEPWPHDDMIAMVEVHVGEKDGISMEFPLNERNPSVAGNLWPLNHVFVQSKSRAKSDQVSHSEMLTRMGISTIGISELNSMEYQPWISILWHNQSGIHPLNKASWETLNGHLHGFFSDDLEKIEVG